MLAALVATAPECTPDFRDDAGRVKTPRVVAIEASPPEAVPNQEVTLRALLGDETGPIEQRAVSWRFCESSPPYTEEGPIDDQCLPSPSPILGTALEVVATLPSKGCSVWGPSPVNDEDRPRDPDTTGGFYQPVVLNALGETWVHLQRIKCPLPDLPQDTSREFSAAYAMNENPAIDDLRGRSSVHGDPVEWDAIEAGTDVELTLRWSSESAEEYAWIDPESRRVVRRREGFSIRWLTTAGVLTEPRTGVDEDDTSTSSTTRWSAPAKPQAVHLWAVLRDSRGGTAVAYRRAAVR